MVWNADRKVCICAEDIFARDVHCTWSVFVLFITAVDSIFLPAATQKKRDGIICKHTQIRVATYEGISKSFRTQSITKQTVRINTRWEATQSVMAAKLTRLTHKIAIKLYLMAESCTICISRYRRPVRKLLVTTSYLSTDKELHFGPGKLLQSVNMLRDCGLPTNARHRLVAVSNPLLFLRTTQPAHLKPSCVHESVWY
jgi:hypothetical protein